MFLCKSSVTEFINKNLSSNVSVFLNPLEIVILIVLYSSSSSSKLDTDLMYVYDASFLKIGFANKTSELLFEISILIFKLVISSSCS